jgi:chemotaxis protein MotA
MLWTSFLGFGIGAGVVAWSLLTSHSAGVFANLHGVVIVFGGTLAGVVFHSDGRHLAAAFGGIFRAFRSSPYPKASELIPILTNLAARAKTTSPAAELAVVDGSKVDGFMGSAARIALQNLQDPETARTLMMRAVHSAKQEANEVVNVFRVASVMAPMFGLIGTLVGIIEVLRNITSPEAVGVSMATAITSAFYGITMANLVCVPLAGKLRGLMLKEAEAKGLVAEGYADIVKGEMPLVVEQRLWTLVDSSGRG